MLVGFFLFAQLLRTFLSCLGCFFFVFALTLSQFLQALFIFFSAGFALELFVQVFFVLLNVFLQFVKVKIALDKTKLS